MDALIYDIEIKKAVPMKGEEPIEGVEYCKGWGDKANMGVSCVGAIEYPSMRPRMFFEDNKEAFAEARREANIIVTFNGIKFDDPVLAANGWIDLDEPTQHYDILAEMWSAKGLNPKDFSKAHEGHGLDATAKANGLGTKTGHGAKAPIDWQEGRYGALTDYCLNDVFLTAALYGRCLDGMLIEPIEESYLEVRRPHLVWPSPSA